MFDSHPLFPLPPLLEVVAFAVAITATNLAAAWAAVSNHPLPLRLLTPAWAWLLGYAVSGAFMARTGWPLGNLLLLEMLKVAAILIVARRAAAGPLRFSLGELMWITAVAAGVLGVATSPDLRSYLPTPEMLAVGGTFSAVTLGALWARLGSRPPAKLRWALLMLLIVLGGYLLAGVLDPVGALSAHGSTQALTLSLSFGLAEHALLVAALSWSWRLTFADRGQAEEKRV